MDGDGHVTHETDGPTGQCVQRTGSAQLLDRSSAETHDVAPGAVDYPHALAVAADSPRLVQLGATPLPGDAGLAEGGAETVGDGCDGCPGRGLGRRFSRRGGGWGGVRGVDGGRDQ